MTPIDYNYFLFLTEQPGISDSQKQEIWNSFTQQIFEHFRDDYSREWGPVYNTDHIEEIRKLHTVLPDAIYGISMFNNMIYKSEDSKSEALVSFHAKTKIEDNAALADAIEDFLKDKNIKIVEERIMPLFKEFEIKISIEKAD